LAAAYNFAPKFKGAITISCELLDNAVCKCSAPFTDSIDNLSFSNKPAIESSGIPPGVIILTLSLFSVSQENREILINKTHIIVNIFLISHHSFFFFALLLYTCYNNNVVTNVTESEAFYV
jgi:hypothetical protein